MSIKLSKEEWELLISKMDPDETSDLHVE